MNFEFIPYKLNSSISDIKEDMEYVDTDNGIALYRVKASLIFTLLEIQITVVNLYFFEGNLITVYMHMDNVTKDINGIVSIISDASKSLPIFFKTNLQLVHGWAEETEFLGLVNDLRKQKLYLYYSCRKYNVYEKGLSNNF